MAKHAVGLWGLLVVSAGLTAQTKLEEGNLAPNAASENQLLNPGFEEVIPVASLPQVQIQKWTIKGDRLPKEWQLHPSWSGGIELITDPKEAHTGSRCVKMWKVPHGGSAYLFSTRRPEIRVSPQNIYRLSVWAKGTGVFDLAYLEYTEKGACVRAENYNTRFLGRHFPLTQDWQRYEVELDPGLYPLAALNPETVYLQMALYLPQKDTYAYFDDAQLNLAGKVRTEQKAGPKMAKVTYLTAAPVIDGKIEPEVWHKLPKEGDFVLFKGEKEMIKAEPTEFCMGYDKSNLYLAFNCTDRHLVVGEKDKKIWRDDSLEIWLCPANNAAFLHHFTLNASGDRLYDFSGKQQETAWPAKCFSGKDSWTAEVAIPFELLGAKSIQDEDWLMNIDRNHIDPEHGSGMSLWSVIRLSVENMRSTVDYGHLKFLEVGKDKD